MLAPVRFFEPGRRNSKSISVEQNDLHGLGIAHQDVIDGMAVVVALEAESGGGVGLGVAVDQEDLEAFERQAGGKVDGCGGFANSALLVDDAENLSHGNPE